jgi:hypothetical protein
MLKLIKRYWLNLSIIWFFYGIIIIASANISWRPELKQDGWYRIYEEEETDYDGRGGNNSYTIIKSIDGPYTKYEIDKLYSNEMKENNVFINSYGTIYNLPYWLYNKNYKSYHIIGLFIHFIFLFMVPYLLYSIVKNNIDK